VREWTGGACVGAAVEPTVLVVVIHSRTALYALAHPLCTSHYSLHRAAVTENFNQYCRSAGHTPLVNAIAKRYTAELGRPINPDTEVTVGVGASECLFALMQSFVNPGDEVILISPAFDIYIAQAQMAGGVCKYVPLRLKADPANPGQQVWSLDMDELRAAFSERTALLLLNTPQVREESRAGAGRGVGSRACARRPAVGRSPLALIRLYPPTHLANHSNFYAAQNPTGKILTRDELTQIAGICADFPRALVVSDEVYEHMIYDGHAHTRMATIPGAWAARVRACGGHGLRRVWRVGAGFTRLREHTRRLTYRCPAPLPPLTVGCCCRHVGPHRDRVLRGQDVLVHRVEDRLGRGAGAPGVGCVCWSGRGRGACPADFGHPIRRNTRYHRHCIARFHCVPAHTRARSRRHHQPVGAVLRVHARAAGGRVGA
jgi:hypothetical protein